MPPPTVPLLGLDAAAKLGLSLCCRCMFEINGLAHLPGIGTVVRRRSAPPRKKNEKAGRLPTPFRAAVVPAHF